MKKFVALTLALLLALSTLLLPAIAEAPRTVRFGMLSVLNGSEAEMADYRAARMRMARQLEKEDIITKTVDGQNGKPNVEITFFDTLDAMLMALEAGDIDSMEVYSSTAQYLVNNNPELALVLTLGDEMEVNTFAELALHGLMANDFAFMFMEKDADLRDAFDAALASITEAKKDQLIQDNITAAINGEEVKPVQMPVIDGAETIRVAVTGSLPPMDYVAADGSPAGYNTAVLAEISKRIGKNIELVIVDSVGRAAALSSGTVDAVFWTRTNSQSNHVATLSEDERAQNREALAEDMSEEESETMKNVREMVDIADYGRVDMPEGTIITRPFFSDTIVAVATRAYVDELKARVNN